MSTRVKLGMVAVVCFAMMLVWTTSAAAFEKTYNVGNRVWLDLDGMGDQDATGETGFDGVTVTLSGTKTVDGSALTIVMNTTTADLANLPKATPDGDVVDGHGCYNFNVPAGTYTITVDAVNTLSMVDLSVSGPSRLIGLTQTHDLNGGLDNSATVTVTDANIYNVDFGYKPADDLKTDLKVGDRVWSDLDKDGKQDAGEPGINGVSVTLWSADGEELGTTTTTAGTDTNGNKDGLYLFSSLPEGDYRVTLSNTPVGATCTYDLASPFNGDSGVFELTEDRFDVDFGYYKCTKPGIELEKTGAAKAKVGDTITYTFKVTNTGGTTLTNLYLDDPMLGGKIWTASSLAAGTSVTFVKTYKVTSADCDSDCDGGGWGYGDWDGGCGSYGGGYGGSCGGAYGYGGGNYGGGRNGCGSYGWNCTTGGGGGGGSWGGGCGGTTTCKLVNTATVTGYVSCWSKLTDTSTWTTTVTKTTTSGNNCGSWGNGGGSYGGGSCGGGSYGGGRYGSWGYRGRTSGGSNYSCFNR